MNTIDRNELRSQWEFAYLPSEVLEGAKKRLAFHESRRQFWADEYKGTEQKIKDKGFQISDSSSSTTYTGAVQLIADRELTARLSQCREKLNKHDLKIKEYQLWTRTLEAREKRDPSASLQLRFQDIEFFGL